MIQQTTKKRHKTTLDVPKSRTGQSLLYIVVSTTGSKCYEKSQSPLYFINVPRFRPLQFITHLSPYSFLPFYFPVAAIFILKIELRKKVLLCSQHVSFAHVKVGSHIVKKPRFILFHLLRVRSGSIQPTIITRKCCYLKEGSIARLTTTFSTM